VDIDNYQALGLHVPFIERGGRNFEVNGRSNAEIMQALAVPEDNQYHPCAEAYPVEDVERGEVREFKNWQASSVFVGTERDIWIYLPASMKSDKGNDKKNDTAPALLVCNDGLGYADPRGPVRATAVLDTLIHSGALPPTVGVFVMPGRVSEDEEENRYQRGVEYDSVTEDFVEFLDADVLPFVEAEIGCVLAKEPRQRTIAGISSGGICAFNAAWHRPCSFGRVLSHCGSFVSLRGGIHYPYLIKSTPRKDIKVFLQSGARDANIIVGDWPLANKSMARALDYAGYNYRFEFGEGGHSLRHGGAMFAESLTWLAADSN